MKAMTTDGREIDLNPEALRRPQGKRKVTTDKDFMETAVGEEPKAFGSIVRDAGRQLKMSRSHHGPVSQPARRGRIGGPVRRALLDRQAV